MRHKLFGILLFFFLITSCQDEPNVKEDSLEFETLRIEKKSDPQCDTLNPNCTRITLELLKATGKPAVAQVINEVLVRHVISSISSDDSTEVKSLDSLATAFITDYERSSQSFSQEPHWEAFLNQSIYKRDEKLVSIGVSTYIFRGGAHGYRNLSFFNFDPDSGQLLSWKDIFTPGFKKYAEMKFRQEQEIPSGDNINSTGFWFKNDVFQLPSSIGLTEENVLLVYNSYEIAPYVDGDFQIKIPLEEVRQFLKK